MYWQTELDERFLRHTILPLLRAPLDDAGRIAFELDANDRGNAKANLVESYRGCFFPLAVFRRCGTNWPELTTFGDDATRRNWEPRSRPVPAPRRVALDGPPTR